MRTLTTKIIQSARTARQGRWLSHQVLPKTTFLYKKTAHTTQLIQKLPQIINLDEQSVSIY